MVEVAGKPILTHCFEQLVDLGAEELVGCLGRTGLGKLEPRDSVRVLFEAIEGALETLGSGAVVSESEVTDGLCEESGERVLLGEEPGGDADNADGWAHSLVDDRSASQDRGEDGE
jgi:NDP-sugar pyrophosphorylase family protein